MTIKNKRPRSVTITFLGVMLLGAWSAAEALALTQQVDLLLELAVRPDPRILMIIAAAWMVLFWASAIGLWHRHPLTRWLIPALLILFALYRLVLQGLFVPIPISGQSWLLRILLYDAAILFAIWSLNRSAAISYFSAAQPAAITEDKE